MSQAFEITEDDVLNVLASNQISVLYEPFRAGESREEMARRLLGEIDLDQVEAMALCGDDMDEQTDYAYDEITRQLKEKGVLIDSEQARQRQGASA